MRIDRSIAIITGAAILFLLSGPVALAETSSFEDPTYGRHRLDFCRYDQIDCGIMPALLFCQREGFEGVQSYRGPDAATPTTRIGNRSTCRGRSCSGFAEVICERADPEPEPDETANDH